MTTNLFFASTPLHTILSSAIALEQSEDTNLLVLIDQQPGVNNIYQQTLKTFTPQLFTQLYRLDRHTQIINKLTIRKQNFNKLAELVDKYKPDKIFTGSDRRVEFQFAISRAAKHKQVVGIYIDEGTYSYTTRNASQTIGEKYIDNLAKKITYGFWWRHPASTGSSAWIDQCWLFFPKHANNYLQKKQLCALKGSLLTNQQMQRFFDKLVNLHKIDTTKIQQLTHLLTLPHESLLDKKAYESYSLIIKNLQNKQAKVGVKLHPRSNPNSIKFMYDSKPFYTLSGSLAFETILVRLPKNLVIIGDMSSTLLVTKWFLPDTRIYAIAAESKKTNYHVFLHKIGVKVLQKENLQQLI